MYLNTVYIILYSGYTHVSQHSVYKSSTNFILRVRSMLTESEKVFYIPPESHACIYIQCLYDWLMHLYYCIN